MLYTQIANTPLSELLRFTVTTTTAKDERDLLPSGRIESDNPQMIALAKELTAGKSLMNAGRAVFEWTANNVRYDCCRGLYTHAALRYHFMSIHDRVWGNLEEAARTNAMN